MPLGRAEGDGRATEAHPIRHRARNEVLSEMAERVGFGTSSDWNCLVHSQIGLNRNNRIHGNRRCWDKTGIHTPPLLRCGYARRKSRSVSLACSHMSASLQREAVDQVQLLGLGAGFVGRRMG